MTPAPSQLAPELASSTLPPGRTLLAHLLHALNQPLTGLQCSLELAATGQRRPDQYIRTLHEGLELVARMRTLVEAVRELADARQSNRSEMALAGETVLLDGLLRETTEELRPVAETRAVHLSLTTGDPLPVRAIRSHLAVLIFRFLESALTLAMAGTDLRLRTGPEDGSALLVASWVPAAVPQHSPFSRPELGLLLAQAGWEQIGAEWTRCHADSQEICTIRLPLSSSPADPQP